MAKVKSYCSRCQRDVDIDDCREVSTKKNKKLFSGTCPECGAKLMQEVDKLEGLENSGMGY
jgi:DNA-directed RNA polymerase subunit RPC12/RpoP